MASSSMKPTLLAICPDTGIQTGDICPICIEEINPDAGYVNTQCSHKYCLECFCKYITINNNLLDNSNCAVCRHHLQYNEGKPANPTHCKLKCGHVLSYKSLCESINNRKHFSCCYCREEYYCYQCRDDSISKLIVFARYYNVLRYYHGLGGLAFSS